MDLIHKKVEETKEVKEAVAAVEAKIEAARLKRVEDKVKETKVETEAREEAEELELKAAKETVSVEAKAHADSRNARVLRVKTNTENARLARLALEKTGVAETAGAKLDREAKEHKDLEEASKLYTIEPISPINQLYGNGDMNALKDKINEIIHSHCQGK